MGYGRMRLQGPEVVTDRSNGAVEVIDSRQGTDSTGEGLQWPDDELGGNLGFELEFVQKSSARQL
jgi:hypothetical protein